MAMKTPGVYIVEKNAFPNSVVEVATAVPAFIGYTEKASNGGNPLQGKPWRIASMAEFERYFGGAPVPRFKVQRVKEVDPAKSNPSQTAAPPADPPNPPPTDPAKQAVDDAKSALDTAEQTSDDATKAAALTAKRAAKQAADDLAARPEATDEQKAAASTLKAELEALEAADAKTVKDQAVSAARTKLLQAQAKAFYARMTKGAANETAASAPVPGMVKARAQVTEFTLKGTKYRLVREPGGDGQRYMLHQAMRHFFQNGGGPCYVVSVGDFKKGLEAGDEQRGLVSGLGPLVKEQEPTMVVVPDAVSLPRSDCATVQTAMLKHCGYDMRNRVALLDVWGGDLDRQATDPGCIEAFRDDIGTSFLDFAAAYYPWLHTSLMQARDFSYWMLEGGGMADTPESKDGLAALIWDELGLAKADPAVKRTQECKRALNDLTKTRDDWMMSVRAAIESGSGTAKQKADALKRLEDPELAKDDIDSHRMLLDKSLLAMSDLYAKIRDEALVQMNLMPPSAAMAGLFTMVDNTRGVWKAPANVSVAGVIKPAVEISAPEQEDLNVTVQGKSINAIRSFIGEGALVWGARTLDGNSLDWRYINVRRTMIMLEESCRLAAKAMVFEPNVANTWVTIKSMISNFLTGIWKRGGLAGAVPEDAFSVHVGLGETMTPEDILEGILRITVLVAISRPAEFIEITFQQQMQKS